MTAINLTAAVIEKLRYNPAGPSRQVQWDLKVRGLGARVTPSGGRQFVLLYRRHGRTKLMSLGRVEDFKNVTDARETAAEHLRKLRRHGVDPIRERQREAAAGTVSQLLERWLIHITNHRKARTAADYTWTVKQILNPEFGTLRPTDVVRPEVRRMHARLSERRGPVTANRALQTLRAAYNWASRQDDGTLPANFANPVKGCEFNREKARDEYLRPEELPVIARAIEAEPDPWARGYLWLAILTGARGAELVTLRWENVDLERAEILLPDTKNKTDFQMKLAAAAVEVLRKIPRRGPYVFPPRRNDGKKPHMATPRGAWAAILKRAGVVRRVTMHDVRRSVGVLLSTKGYSAEQIARQLNHKSNVTAKVYIKIVDSVQQRMADDLDLATSQVVALPAPATQVLQ